MNRAALIFALCSLLGRAGATGLEPWQGSDVLIEAFADPILVNGLPFIVHRANGSGVDRLEKAIRQRWNQETGEQVVRSISHGNWVVLSRIHKQNLEVLQRRGRGAEAELLWSSADLRVRGRSLPLLDFPLPSGCETGSIVHGNVDTERFTQQTVVCPTSPRETMAALDAIAKKRSFTVEHQGALQLIARRRATEITVLVSDSEASVAPYKSTVVYLQIQKSRAAP